MASPMLVLVTGAPGTGKTTVATDLAVRLRVPAFAHDDVRAGIASAEAVQDLDAAQAIGPRAWSTYYDLVRFLAAAGVSFIADAHFHRGRSEVELAGLVGQVRMLLVHCVAERAVVVERVRRRRGQADRTGWLAIGDRGVLERMESGTFEWHVHDEPLDLSIPRLIVDTTAGPDLDLIERFIAVN